MTLHSLQAWAVLSLGVVAGSAFGQSGAPGPYRDASRADISAARLAQDKVSEERVRDCYSRFAVTQCLADATSERLASRDQLNARERELNDLQRSKNAQLQIERLEQKQTAHQARIRVQGPDETKTLEQSKRKEVVSVPRSTAQRSPGERAERLTAAQRTTNLQNYELSEVIISFIVSKSGISPAVSNISAY